MNLIKELFAWQKNALQVFQLTFVIILFTEHVQFAHKWESEQQRSKLIKRTRQQKKSGLRSVIGGRLVGTMASQRFTKPPNYRCWWFLRCPDIEVYRKNLMDAYIFTFAHHSTWCRDQIWHIPPQNGKFLRKLFDNLTQDFTRLMAHIQNVNKKNTCR